MSLLAVDVRLPMAGVAKGDQVQLRVGPAVTAKLLMMDFQIRHRAAGLAAPGVASKHLLAKVLVGFGFEPRPWLCRSYALHEALDRIDSRNVCFCFSGSSPKNLFIENSRVSGSPLSRLAPARKSAQIISRQ